MYISGLGAVHVQFDACVVWWRWMGIKGATLVIISSTINSKETFIVLNTLPHIQEHYIFCHEVLDSYVKSFGDYSNFQ